MRLMILLSLFEDYFIVVIMRSIYCRYLTFISLSLFDFNFRENRNSCFFKYIFIMRSRTLLLLFSAYYVFDNFIIIIRCLFHLFDARLVIIIRF